MALSRSDTGSFTRLSSVPKASDKLLSGSLRSFDDTCKLSSLSSDGSADCGGLWTPCFILSELHENFSELCASDGDASVCWKWICEMFSCCVLWLLAFGGL